jgi:hypothetical protein
VLSTDWNQGKRCQVLIDIAETAERKINFWTEIFFSLFSIFCDQLGFSLFQGDLDLHEYGFPGFLLRRSMMAHQHGVK